MFKDLEPNEKKTLIFWLILGVIIMILVFIWRYHQKEEKKEEKYKNNKYLIVENYNRYYTVTGAINKYYSFINDKNYQSVLNILDEDYKKDNKIVVNNLNDFITNKDVNLSYHAGIMCYKELSEGITSYIVSGEEVTSNSLEKIDDKYYEIILDGNKFHFSIKPIDEKFYGGNCHG